MLVELTGSKPVRIAYIGIRIFWVISNDFFDKNCPYLATAIAYYALFALFPFALAIVLVMGYLLGPDVVNVELATKIGQLVPVSTELVVQSLGYTVDVVVTTGAVPGTVGIVGLLWVSLAVFSAIRKGVNNVWGIRQPRPFFQERLIDFGLMFGAGVLFLGSFFASATLSLIKEIYEIFTPEDLSQATLLVEGVFNALPLVITFGIFLFLYKFLPNAKVGWREVLPSAVIVTLAFDLAKNLFVIYVKSYNPYNLIYGPVGAVIALLAWVYISALIFLTGALMSSWLAYYLEYRRQGKVDKGLIEWIGINRANLELRSP